MGRALSPHYLCVQRHLPEGSIFKDLKHLILHVDAKFDFEVPEFLALTGEHGWGIHAVTITLGWRDHHYEPALSTATQCKAICAILDYIYCCNLYDVNIVVSPFLELDEHYYCFPTIKPRDIAARGMTINSITFKSSCACGQGDFTGGEFRWRRGPSDWSLNSIRPCEIPQYGRKSKRESMNGYGGRDGYEP